MRLYMSSKAMKSLLSIENCSMWFTNDEWPGGQNLMTTPVNWRKVFAVLDSPNFGINYDPSHFIWQQIDYIKPLYEFKDKIFYIMISMLTCRAVFGLMTISQASPIGQNMICMSVAAATTAVSVLALFNAAGRVLAGWISDKIGRINTLFIMLVIAVGGRSLLYFANEGAVVQFYLGMSVVGLCFGSFMGVFPGFTADQFGQKNNSVNYGIMFIGFALAGYLGPTIMGSVYGSSGSYKPAFLIAMILAAAGIVLSFIYRILNKRSQSKS